MHRRISIFAAVVLAALVGTAVATAVTRGGSGRKVRVVATAKNARLGRTVLVTTKGLTLYSLSVERNGKFVCVAKACLSFWHPLVVKAGATPTGTSGLATVMRPDGTHQVTYHGGPLYTFSGDHARGDDRGEGFKDVGVWHAATVGGGTAPAPAPTTTSSGGGYHY